MRKQKNIISFEKQFLDSLVEDKNSCVKLREHVYNLSLHPFHLNNINESIKDILNQGIPKYNKELGGILLGYSNITLLSNVGSILNDNYYIYITVKAQFYIFDPDVDKTLIGTVNKKSQNHVGCLIHGTFNVSLPNPNEENDDEDDWLGSKLSIGQKILLRVSFIKLESRLPYIRGEIISILNEIDDSTSMVRQNSKKTFSYSDSDEEIEIEKHRKKQMEIEESILQPEEIEAPTKSKKHKHKKKNITNVKCDKEFDLNNHFTNIRDEELADYNKKKKSKRKYSESLAIDETVEDEFTNFNDIEDKYAEKKIPKYKFNEMSDDNVNSFEESQHVRKKRKLKHKSNKGIDLDINNDFTNSIESESIIKHKKSNKKHCKLLENHNYVDKKSNHLRTIKQEFEDHNYELEFSNSKKKKIKIKNELNKHRNSDVEDMYIEEIDAPKKKTKRNSLEELQKSILEKTVLSLKKHKHK